MSLRPLTALLLLALAGPALAEPPAGRYRCYQPPGYGVMAWFDLGAEGIAVDGNPALPVRFEGGRLQLPAKALPPWTQGVHLAPGAGDGERVTIVLAREGQGPGHPAWARLPRCYLTTH